MTIEPAGITADAASHDLQSDPAEKSGSATSAPDAPLPFEDSRRLTGPNLYFADTGAVLETAADLSIDVPLIRAWRDRLRTVLNALDWPVASIVAHRHATGAAFAFSAAIDQLYTATEVNEWAFCASLPHTGLTVAPRPRGGDRFFAPGHAAVWDDESALYTLRKLAAQESNPPLMALVRAARAHDLPVLLDDEMLTIGEGAGSRSWPLAALPPVDDIAWHDLHAIPVVLVTGSNGKTTTTRLLAAMLAERGVRCGYSSTDGVFCAGACLESGDFSGPMGARAVLRQVRVEAAVLETARGGILRRGLAVDHAQAAIVTNISADHFGEYGIHDLDGLADAKLVVARGLAPDGTLVLNANDVVLVRRAGRLEQRIAWFARDAGHPLLASHRMAGGDTCGVLRGHLILHVDDADLDLGAVADMPLTLGGAASYNIENIAGSALLAHTLGLPLTVIRAVLRTFGSSNTDNPGRLMRWSLGGVQVLLDYAHNPEGLHGLLDVAATLRGAGRMSLVLGQAGNRENADIRRLADVAAQFHPDLIVLKDIQSFLRGREPGEIAALLRDELVRKSIPNDRIVTRLDEVEAARATLQWCRVGDVLVLPIHDSQARAEVVALLDQLHAANWVPGEALPVRSMSEPSAASSLS